MRNRPTVSVIIPVYNSFLYIEKSLKSAINQTYKDLEIIVIDDGSNAETKTKLQELKGSIDVLLSQENKGPSAARNYGIEKAKGDFILILDSDDYFKPTFLEKAISILKECPEVKFVSCFLDRFEGDKIGPIVKMNGGPLHNYLFRNASIGNGLFRRVDIDRAGGYDESMRNGYVDWELMIRVLKEGGEVHVIPEPLFMYRSNLKIITNRAKNKRPEILSYILKKHSDIYKENYDLVIDFFEKEQKKLIGNTSKIHCSKEYKLGRKLLAPFYSIKKNFYR